MKINYILLLTVLLAQASSGDIMDQSTSKTVLGAGARYHSKHSVYLDLPYDDGDISAYICYEGHQEDSFWQIAVDYAFDLNGIETVDYVITPQFNLLWKDRIWFGGLGVLYPYIDDSVSGGDWLDLYWQLLLGVKIPIYAFSIDLGVQYPFESWGDIDEIDVKDLDYTVGLSLGF